MKNFTLLRNSFLAAMLLSATIVSAQDIHFSEFTQSPLTVNPALAGTTVWIRAAAIYRTQWSAVTVPYSTLGASFDVKTKKQWIKIKYWAKIIPVSSANFKTILLIDIEQGVI